MNVRNIAIIAHVDHGKTTLVDALLCQAHAKLSKDVVGTQLIMDSNDLEKERGITIFSKNASVVFKDVKINIIDTPGHADFGGEVERVLSMADGCLLLVDAKEGPMPQTRFVLKKALALSIPIIIVVNKIDKPDANPKKALDRTFDLFLELGADETFLDFPTVYASSKEGKAGTDPDLQKMKDISPLFDVILEKIPKPTGEEEKPLQILITSLAQDSFKGKLGIGKIHNGVVKSAQEVIHINRKGEKKNLKITSLMTFVGLEKQEVESASVGDIIAIAGIPEITIGETIADKNSPTALPSLKIDQPTVKMRFLINNSPFSGKEGVYSTSRQLRERLYKELQTDVAMRIEELESDSWVVSGRGELHLAIFIERLRREGYELQVGRPQVITIEKEGKILVPYEMVSIEVPDNFSGVVIEKLGKRNGIVKNMYSEGEIAFLEFLIPTRGLFGYRGEFLTDTKGLGIMNNTFYEYSEDAKNWKEREQGSLVSLTNGETNLYGLVNIQKRGLLFLGPNVSVYPGQVIGQHSRTGDLSVNPCKTKKLSNMRSKGEGVSEHFNMPQTMDLEAALLYIGDDELVEITPKSIRMRKIK
jgi:GTP-binding protein